MFYEKLLKMFNGEITNGVISMRRIMGVLEYYEIWSEKFKEGEECKEEFTALVCEVSGIAHDARTLGTRRDARADFAATTAARSPHRYRIERCARDWGRRRAPAPGAARSRWAGAHGWRAAWYGAAQPPVTRFTG